MFVAGKATNFTIKVVYVFCPAQPQIMSQPEKNIFLVKISFKGKSYPPDPSSLLAPKNYLPSSLSLSPFFGTRRRLFCLKACLPPIHLILVLGTYFLHSFFLSFFISSNFLLLIVLCSRYKISSSSSLLYLLTLCARSVSIISVFLNKL